MNIHLATRPLAFALATLLAPAVQAAAPVGNATAWDLSVDIDLIGLAQLNVGAQTSAHLVAVVDTADDSQQLPSSSFGSSPLNLITLSTGLLESSTEYVGHGSQGMSAIAARSSVNDLALAAGLVGNPDGILGISASTISSQTALAGSCPNAAPKGPSLQGMLDDFMFYSSFDAGNLIGGGGDGGGGGGIGGLPPTGGTLVDPAISILDTNVPGLPLNPAPNTPIDLDVLGIVGATLILNEQTRSGDGVHSLSTASNALHLTLDVANLVTAEVIIAHSEASLACP